LRLLSGEGLSDRLAEAHASYAELFEARGDKRRASEQWKKAAKLALRSHPIPLRSARVV